MAFDPNIILSSSYTLNFIVESDNTELVISSQQNLYSIIDLLFTVISYLTLGVFFLSFGHKMIGA